jgi:hypothetical protein
MIEKWVSEFCPSQMAFHVETLDEMINRNRHYFKKGNGEFLGAWVIMGVFDTEDEAFDHCRKMDKELDRDKKVLPHNELKIETTERRTPMPKVVCLMKCDRTSDVEIWKWNEQTKKNEPKVGKEIHLTPIHTGEFFDATPYGELKIGILNEEASKQFQVGKYYYMTFEEKVEEPREQTPPANPL